MNALKGLTAVLQRIDRPADAQVEQSPYSSWRRSRPNPIPQPSELVFALNNLAASLSEDGAL